jgi:hypothetical protein
MNKHLIRSLYALTLEAWLMTSLNWISSLTLINDLIASLISPFLVVPYHRDSTPHPLPLRLQTQEPNQYYGCYPKAHSLLAHWGQTSWPWQRFPHITLHQHQFLILSDIKVVQLIDVVHDSWLIYFDNNENEQVLQVGTTKSGTQLHKSLTSYHKWLETNETMSLFTSKKVEANDTFT